MAARLSFTSTLRPILYATQEFHMPALRYLVLVQRSHSSGRSLPPARPGEHETDDRQLFSKFPSGIPAERRDIISELNKVIYGKSARIGARHGIQSRLETLESLGCSLDEIQAQPDVLLLTENEVIGRVIKLRKSQTDVTVCNIKAAGVKSHTSSFDVTYGHKKGSALVKKREICSLLKCSFTELSALEKQCPTLKYSNNKEDIIAKINFFLLNGFTVDDIKQNVFILRRKLTKIADLINSIKSIDQTKSKNRDQNVVKLFIDSELSMQTSKPRRENSDLRHQLLAELFEVDVSYIRDLGYANTRFETVLNKVTFLTEIGIDRTDILNHFYLVRHSLKKLEKGVEMAKEAGITKLTAVTLINVIQHRYVPPRHGKSRHRAFISSLLDIPTSELRNLGQNVLSVFSVDKLVLKTNIEYLQSQGFSKSDIKQCLLVIGHDPEMLIMYVESLSKRPEFQPYEEYSRDKVMILNAVQYLIERDSNFNCKEQIGVEKVTVEGAEIQEDA